MRIQIQVIQGNNDFYEDNINIIDKGCHFSYIFNLKK